MNEGQGSPDAAPVMLKPAAAVQQKDNPFTHDPRSSFFPDTAHKPAPDMLSATPLPTLNLKNEANANDYRSAFGLPAAEAPADKSKSFTSAVELENAIKQATEVVQEQSVKQKLAQASAELSAIQTPPDSDLPATATDEGVKTKREGVLKKIWNWLALILASIGIPVGFGTKNAFETEMGPPTQGVQ